MKGRKALVIAFTLAASLMSGHDLAAYAAGGDVEAARAGGRLVNAVANGDEKAAFDGAMYLFRRHHNDGLSRETFRPFEKVTEIPPRGSIGVDDAVSSKLLTHAGHAVNAGYNSVAIRPLPAGEVTAIAVAYDPQLVISGQTDAWPLSDVDEGWRDRFAGVVHVAFNKVTDGVAGFTAGSSRIEGDLSPGDLRSGELREAQTRVAELFDRTAKKAGDPLPPSLPEVTDDFPSAPDVVAEASSALFLPFTANEDPGSQGKGKGR